MRQRGVARSHLSITDETGMASAFVILEGPAA
jgi:phosphopantetheinyl transferase (holo-ACP synthase)